MARIIHTGETPAKRRRADMRTCAELLRLLAQKTPWDDEARDMTALFVIVLRRIGATIEESANVWDDRQYWKKAEALRAKWRWCIKSADRLEAQIRAGDWSSVPDELMTLFPHFAHITVNSITRNVDWWCGAYQSLMRAET